MESRASASLRWAPMKDRVCPRCGAKIEAMTLGGGQVYYCPGCQK